MLFLRRTVQMIAAIILIALSSVHISAYAEEIVVYGGEAFKPQSYLENGEPAGMIPTLFKHVSKRSGDTYKLILLPWKRAVSESTDGLGGITSFTRTAERAGIFDFSEPLFRNRVQLVVLKDKAFKFSTLDNLRGKIIGLPLGSSFGDAFDQAARDNVFSVDPDTNQTSRIKKLFLGRIDIAVIGRVSFDDVLKSDPQLFENRDQFMLLTNSVIEDQLYLAFPKSMHMQAALRRFNRALIAFKKTKTYQDIISAYAN